MGFLDLLKKEFNRAFTENGALSYRSSESSCLDLFYRMGGMRNASESEIGNLTERAYCEDKDMTMKILFFARDVRGGLGERRFFRIAMLNLAVKHTSSVIKNLDMIPEYGRWDDIMELYDIPQLTERITEIIKAQLDADMKCIYSQMPASLLAKWLPSVNTSSEKVRKKARKLAAAMKMTERQYRKILSALRKYTDIIENRLREKDYSFDYAKQPSRAMHCYRKAFIRNDGERYRKFISLVNQGEAKMNSGTLYPYDVVRAVIHEKDENQYAALNAEWISLHDIADDSNSIAVIDGSGSMYWNCNKNMVAPYEAALSLGIYFAEHSRGAFAGHFITFSMTPQLVPLKGNDIAQKVHNAMSYNECSNTDIQAVFDLILKTAVKNRVSRSDMPEKIYIISDMEFDSCVFDGRKNLTNFEAAKIKFKSFGYRLPSVIFWNVASRNEQVPVKMHDNGAALISGFSPKIFDMVKSGEIDPYKLMTDIILSERYSKISA